MPDDATESVTKNSFLGCRHQSTCMPSYSLYIQLLWYPMYYPGEMKARVSPVQSIEPHRMLASNQDSNQRLLCLYVSPLHLTKKPLRTYLLTWFKKERRLITYESDECRTVVDYILSKKSEIKISKMIRVQG